MCFLVSLANPLSRGTVHITSGSVQNLPAVDQYLSHPVDIEILARHVQWVPTLVGTKPLADYVKPNGAVLPKGTDHVKRNTVTFNHPCGTGAMMSFDLGGVVDDRLRVNSVNSLRVVDASVFPMIPKGFIQSSVYAVAEKAADLIKEGGLLLDLEWLRVSY
ncbi:glucose-methanol-choline oxidoreductase [Lipomyces tetrasporus]|uniref:Glucose-methanol-choline oxidoreductase n=1 Tax=Lipomyces tetrasporus TaxID=54092 RepID=A0AAD7QW16_9ASCO|nr:glucose-methanol-choline oxidoreductase [Lipomyces tetrasporus]KAJ8102390.1 glucose-methanol-choline oxidoreductase [Lipomyces tetrasporus]